MSVIPEWIEDRYSNYQKLLRVNAWIARFINNLKAKRYGKPLILANNLTVNEFDTSENHLFLLAQEQHFHEDRACLSQGKKMKTTSKLLPLNPTIGKCGLLLVGGRLNNSSLSYCQKHPPILPGKDVLTKLLISSLHISLCHCGPSLLPTHAGSMAHIIGARRLIRTVCRSFVTCRKTAARREEQQMGQLPSSRVTPSPVFSKTDIDYAGPFLLKKGYTRKPVLIKTYMCILVCFSTKAVHLEAVSDLSTESFLATLKRFVSRRGLLTEIHSDNGSNFKGTANDLKHFYEFLSRDSTQHAVHHHLLSSRVNWIFSPERAPHFGGLWEAAVKSAKLHLKRIIGQQTLT